MASLHPTEAEDLSARLARATRERRVGDTFEQGGWTHPHLTLLKPPRQRPDEWTLWTRLALLAAVALLLTIGVLAFGAQT